MSFNSVAKTVKYTMFLALFMSFFGCNKTKFKLAESGLKYKIIVENEQNPKPTEGDVVSIKFRYTDEYGKLIEESDLFRTQLKSPSHSGGCIEDAIAMMHKGDSAVFKINAEKYYIRSRKERLPENLKAQEDLIFYIRLVGIKNIEEFRKERQMAYISDARNEEKLLKDFLKKTNITVEPTSSGLYFIELEKGTGKKPEPGKNVSVHYMGYFVDSQIFDSSYERKQPFVFKYGVGEVIQGWDEALGLMQVGGRYKLIIPSHLAYGSQKQGPIPPYSTLIFEIELLQAE